MVSGEAADRRFIAPTMLQNLRSVMDGVNHIVKKFRAIALRSTPQPSSIPFFPEEVIFNILVFLPADILYNVMRYVCREWNNIISNPNFVKAHFEKLTKCLVIQCTDHREAIDFVETNNDKDNVGLRKLRYGFSNRILSSCDGLVLLCHDSNNLVLCVANLITNQIQTLPPLFEPIFEYRSVPVLVYANSIRRYKVVHLFPVIDGHDGLVFKCAILTVGAETAWRLIDIKHIPNTDLLYSYDDYFKEIDSTLFAGGYVYWTPELRYSTNYLLALDVEAEIMHKFPNPRLFIGEGGYFIVRESFLTFMFNDDMKFVWEVYALTELNTGGEWIWLLKIDLIGQSGSLIIHCRLHPKKYSGCNLYPLAWLKNGELVIFRDSIPSINFIVYNVKSRQFSSFSVAKNGTYYHYYFHAHVNSLVSLKTTP